MDPEQKQQYRQKTTIGWEMLMTFTDGFSKWIRLADCKESYIAITEEPAFAWWVKDLLHKRDVIIFNVKSKYWRRSH